LIFKFTSCAAFKPPKEIPGTKETKNNTKKETKKDTDKPDKKKPNLFLGDLFGGFRDTMHGIIKSATSEDPDQDTDNDE
jgi:hypothetical protein